MSPCVKTARIAARTKGRLLQSYKRNKWAKTVNLSFTGKSNSLQSYFTELCQVTGKPKAWTIRRIDREKGGSCHHVNKDIYTKRNRNAMFADGYLNLFKVIISSSVRTLRSLVRILLETRMYIYLVSVFVWSCICNAFPTGLCSC
jgi:hypothetical protein